MQVEAKGISQSISTHLNIPLVSRDALIQALSRRQQVFKSP